MSDRIITIATFTLSSEMHLFRARLEEEGIHVIVGDENMTNLDPYGAYASGGAKLRVFEAEAEDAQKIIEQMRAELAEIPEEEQYLTDVDGTMYKVEEDEEEMEYQASLALKKEQNAKIGKVILIVGGITIALSALAGVLAQLGII